MNKTVLAVVVFALMVIGIFMIGKSGSFFTTSNTENSENGSTPTGVKEYFEINKTSDVTPTESDLEVLPTVIKAALINKNGQNAESLNIEVSEIEGGYAKGSASEQGEGGLWFAAKVNEKWRLVWDGNGVIECDSITPYPNFPTSLIPECFDTNTNEVVSR